MQTFWDPDQASPELYDEVERHSDGMVSFTYRPPAPTEKQAEAKPGKNDAPAPCAERGN